MWPTTHLVRHFSMTWVNKTYASYTGDLLLKQEKTRIPETTPFAEEIAKERRIRKEISVVQKAINSLSMKMIHSYHKKNRTQEDIEEHAKMCSQKHDLRQKRDELNEQLKMLNHVTQQSQEHRYYIPCPENDCRGFLNEQFECGICQSKACETCHQTYTESHVCDKNTVENVKELAKNTRSCPQCKIPIYKISGCDQMWCTKCHIAFSWNTGQIEKGIIHNPHFYEWKQKNGDTATPMRNPGDHVCGGVPDFYINMELIGCLMFGASIKSYKPYLAKSRDKTTMSLKIASYDFGDDLDWWIDTRKRMINVLLNVRSIQMLATSYQISIDRKRTQANGYQNTLQEMRINYILHTITTDMIYKGKLAKLSKQREYDMEIMLLEEMFVACATDFLNEQESKNRDLEYAMQQSTNWMDWIKYCQNSVQHDWYDNCNQDIDDVTSDKSTFIDIHVDNKDLIKANLEDWLSSYEERIKGMRQIADYCKQHFIITSYVYQIPTEELLLGHDDVLYDGFYDGETNESIDSIVKEIVQNPFMTRRKINEQRAKKGETTKKSRLYKDYEVYLINLSYNLGRFTIPYLQYAMRQLPNYARRNIHKNSYKEYNNAITTLDTKY